MSTKTDTDKAIEEMLTGEEAGTEKEVETSKTEEKPKSEETPSTEETTEDSAQDSEETDWKAEARKWEARSKANREEAEKNKAAADKVAELEKQLDEYKTKAESLTAEREQAEEKASLELTRWKIAAKYGVSEEDVELVLTATDEETLEKQAQRLSGNSPHPPKPDTAQGKRSNTGSLPVQKQGAAALEGLFN